MQGYSHALTGAAGWLAVTTGSVAALGIIHVPPATIIELTVVSAGAALLPDLDHPNGAIAHALPALTLGPVTVLPSPTKGLCELIGRISGGHRHATHSILGVALFAGAAYAASLFHLRIHGHTLAFGAGLFALLMTAFAIKALHLFKGLGLGGASGVLARSWLGPWVASLAFAGWITWRGLGAAWLWLPFAVTLGALIHNLGDSLTVEGVPWLWPFHPGPPSEALAVVWQDNGYFRSPVLGHTHSVRESLFDVAVGLYVLYMLIYQGSRMIPNIPHLLH